MERHRGRDSARVQKEEDSEQFTVCNNIWFIERKCVGHAVIEDDNTDLFRHTAHIKNSANKPHLHLARPPKKKRREDLENE